MLKRSAQILIALIAYLSSNCQEIKIDTLTLDYNNIHFLEFSGTWYDNSWNNPVMRGHSISRIKSDSSRYSLTFRQDGTISGFYFNDLTKIYDSTNWWYDGKYIYFKQFKDSIYTAKKIFINQNGEIIIAFRPSGKFILKRSLQFFSRKLTAANMGFGASRLRARSAFNS